MKHESELWATLERYGGFAGLRKLDTLHLVAEFLDAMSDGDSDDWAWGPEPGFPRWIYSPNVWRLGAVHRALTVVGLVELCQLFDDFQKLLPDGFRGLFGANSSENHKQFDSPAAREINVRIVDVVAQQGDEFAERVMHWFRSTP
ncbi:hypothetical protein [Planctomyces sp. SH-PL14]|uniref:hypothetical protein n=1 Tax=Planctomyces sp. SH-PL14 TaxID=1632864 RepID=UPI00078BDA08|nr:hypothetical protein [Planctomyces sp. SH-PL14]AMV21507.1 hypothetical protein VT03_26630 [Planctomyces sp. SH-PL14]